jgi:hypothetical protein
MDDIVVGASTNGKSGDFGSPMWRFESSRPSHTISNDEWPVIRDEQTENILGRLHALGRM